MQLAEGWEEVELGKVDGVPALTVQPSYHHSVGGVVLQLSRLLGSGITAPLGHLLPTLPIPTRLPVSLAVPLALALPFAPFQSLFLRASQCLATKFV